MTIRNPERPMLIDTGPSNLADILRTAHRENLALRMFLGCCEGWLQSRGTFGDAGLVDMIALVTLNGARIALYRHVAGDVIAADGRRVDFADVPMLIEAHAAQALQLMAHKRLQTAERFKREALDLHDAFVEARRYRSASQPTNLERAKT